MHFYIQDIKQFSLYKNEAVLRNFPPTPYSEIISNLCICIAPTPPTLTMIVMLANINIRHCVLGSLRALTASNVRYFKPDRRSLMKVSDWHDGWRISTGSYFLIPYKQTFNADFPPDWTIFLSFKAEYVSQVGRLRTHQNAVKYFSFDQIIIFLRRELFSV